MAGSESAKKVRRNEAEERLLIEAAQRDNARFAELCENYFEQPRPMVFMLCVDDVDAWYARAVKAEGAISIGRAGGPALRRSRRGG